MTKEILTKSKKTSGISDAEAKKPVNQAKAKKLTKQAKPANPSSSGKDHESPYLNNMTPAVPGLLIVNTTDRSLLMSARSIFESLVTEGADKLCVPVPQPSEVLSILSGKPRKIEQAKAWFDAANSDNVKVPLEYIEFPSHVSFNWFSDEGYLHLKHNIEEDLLITLEQAIDYPINSIISSCINRIENDAKQKNAWVMAFTNCPATFEESGLHNMCDDYFEVSRCEPNPDVDMAFCIDCVGIREMGILSNGKTMCSVTKVNGKLKFDFQPFISHSLKTRVMWILRGQKMSFADIGKKFDVNASTVLRQLADLSKPYNTNADRAWLEHCYEVLEVEPSDDFDNDDYDRD
jgi:hypothetical protein